MKKQEFTWEEKKENFFKRGYPLPAYSAENGSTGYITYQPEDCLYCLDDDGAIIVLERGGWSIMEKIIPDILDNVEGCIVEIGMGESTSVFASCAYERDRKFYSCDIKMGGMFDVCDKPLFDGHTCFIGRSEEFIKEFNDTPAVVFIDGEHTYETCKMEADFFLPLLADEGVMFFHDMFPRDERMIKTEKKGRKAGDVYRVRQELERNPDIDVFTWPYTALEVGLTMVMKHKKDRPYWRQSGRVHNEE